MSRFCVYCKYSPSRLKFKALRVKLYFSLNYLIPQMFIWHRAPDYNKRHKVKQIIFIKSGSLYLMADNMVLQALQLPTNFPPT